MKKWMLVVCLLAFCLSGCKSAGETEKTTVRIGYFPNITHAQALLGKENKYAAALGCPVEWKKFNAGSTEIEAMMAGELDLGYIGPGPAINGFIKTRGDIQIIAGACEGGAVLVSRQDVHINDMKDLANKTIAIPQFGNTQHIVLKKIMDENGLQDTAKGGNVEIVQVENPDVKTLFDKKEIEAAFVPEPWGSILINESQANLVLDYNQTWRDGQYPVAVVIARADFIKQHPDLVRKFLETHVALTETARKDKTAAKLTINKEIKQLTGKEISAEIMDASFDRLILNEEVNQEAVLEMADIMEDLGFIKGQENLNRIFNLDLMNK